MVVVRKDALVPGRTYHVFSRSIAGFRIFSCDAEFSRLVEAMRFFQREVVALRFFKFLKLRRRGKVYSEEMIRWSKQEPLVKIYAYCIMPTHIHLVLKQLKNDGISIFMANILNSYTRYFNTKLGRKGPLWESRFKNVLVETDEQLLHLTRYLHINPTAAGLVEKPEDWPASSYGEYLGETPASERICEFDDVLDVDPISYRQFVEDQIFYQRDLALIKKLALE